MEKYENYLSYMIDVADVVGAVETEIAKYVFADISSIKETKYRAFAKKIKENFNKKGSSIEKALANALNATRDIMYYRLTAERSNELIDEKRQDTWLITADDSLVNLTNSIYFTPIDPCSDSKYVTFNRFAEQKSSDYWRVCDDLYINSVYMRNLVENKTEQQIAE
jgi:hypothetical protein